MKFNFNICFNFNETLCNYCFRYNYKRKIISFVRANERVHDIIKEESKWGEGGVAFIGHESNKDTRTYARKYLITDEQFGEVVEQENNVEALHINVQDVMDKGYVDLEAGWYGRVIYLGKEDGAPMFAFTSPDVMGTYEFTAPPQSYLSMISRGLKEIGITKEEIVEYFLTNPGIEGESTRGLLFRYIFVDYSVHNSKQLIDMLAIVSEIVLKIIKVMSCQLRKKLMTFIFYLTNPTEANTM